MSAPRSKKARSGADTKPIRRRPAVVVSMLHTLSWVKPFRVPEKCPDCGELVVGFYTYEPACGRVNYGGDGTPDGEMPEYFGDDVQELKCNRCGAEIAAGSEKRVEHDTVERARRLLGIVLAECDFDDAKLRDECAAVLRELGGEL